VLFVCVHNAGCSQTPGDAVEVRSAGSAPADQINPVAVETMNEVGIDITDQRSKIFTPEASEASTVVITMGCGDVCPCFPGQTHLDWELDDLAGQGIQAVRVIRDDIRERVEDLTKAYLVTLTRGAPRHTCRGRVRMSLVLPWKPTRCQRQRPKRNCSAIVDGGRSVSAGFVALVVVPCAGGHLGRGDAVDLHADRFAVPAGSG